MECPRVILPHFFCSSSFIYNTRVAENNIKRQCWYKNVVMFILLQCSECPQSPHMSTYNTEQWKGTESQIGNTILGCLLFYRKCFPICVAMCVSILNMSVFISLLLSLILLYVLCQGNFTKLRL